MLQIRRVAQPSEHLDAVEAAQQPVAEFARLGVGDHRVKNLAKVGVVGARIDPGGASVLAIVPLPVEVARVVAQDGNSLRREVRAHHIELVLKTAFSLGKGNPMLAQEVPAKHLVRRERVYEREVLDGHLVACVPEDAMRDAAEIAGDLADDDIGEVTSDFRGVPHGVFRHTRNQVTIQNFPLIDSLTPHKMFRRDFLREHGIAFPEGKRRLEDQLYMVRAYFPAKTVSILGDYPCYFYRKRDDGKNAGTARIDPRAYYANLREVLDTVIANTEPGEFRDRLLRRFYRVEMLGRLSDPSYLKHDDEFRGRLFSEVHQLAADYITDGVEQGLGGLLRLRSVLLRANRPAELLELATRAAQLKAHGRLETLRWEGGRLYAGFSAWFGSADSPPVLATGGTAEARSADGSELFTLLHRGDRYFLDPRLSEALVERLVEVTTELPTFRVQVSLREREK